ncbi:MAG: NUDIX hydrolase [Propionibacteriaceae bacterium]|jgi:ADP-ribose pyrophosphatase|nr:NUDIX hydrolase [Propionibacteriaceae bacterium]
MTVALPGPVLRGGDLADRPEDWSARTVSWAPGRVSQWLTDEVTTPTGQTMVRDWLVHPGAVAIMALDDRNRVAVVAQYRHPVGWVCVEPPAGLLDLADEPALTAAQRELAEEAQLAADDWRVLVDCFTSPGSSQESIRIFLARRLRPAARPSGFVLADEEAEMKVGWVDLDEAVEAVFEGRLQSPTLVMGLLALAAARSAGRLDRLRPAQSDWPARQTKAARDRRWSAPPR